MAPRKAKSKNYFTKDTENAIMLYNSTSVLVKEVKYTKKKYTILSLN